MYRKKYESPTTERSQVEVECGVCAGSTGKDVVRPGDNVNDNNVTIREQSGKGEDDFNIPAFDE